MTPTSVDALVPVATLRAELACLPTLGLDPAPVLAAVGPLPDGHDARVPVHCYLNFWQQAQAQFGRPGVVTAVAMALPFGAFGVLDYLAGSAETARGALAAAQLHLSLVAFGTRLELSEPDDDGLTWLTVRDDSPRPDIGAEFTLATLVHRCRHVTGGAAQPVIVTLPVPAAADEGVRTERFGLRPLFGQPSYACAYPAAALEQPMLRSDPLLHATMKQIAATLALQTGDEASDLELALRSHLRDALASGDATPERLARLLGLSERTLQRRLAEGGRSYSAVVEDFRREEAARLLRGRLPLVRVADQLGYREQTSFTRAFRRWYAATPAAWRRRHSAESAAAAQTERR
jgi:AraC-like DNA-binding protein